METTEKFTNELVNILIECEKRFLSREKPKKSRAFFEAIRHELDEAFKKIDIWEKNALDVIDSYKLRVHPQQIQSTKENMEQIILHSYYVDLRKRRFMEMVKSCHFVFDQLMNQIKINK